MASAISGLTSAGGAASAKDAHERAIQEEEMLLRSWVGKLEPESSNPKYHISRMLEFCCHNYRDLLDGDSFE